MKLDISWWDIPEAHALLEPLRSSLDASALAEWNDVAELALKVWFSDSTNQRWGAAMLWDSDSRASRALPPNLAQRVIGRAPSARLQLNVEAVAGRLAPELAAMFAGRGASSAGPSLRTRLNYVLVDAFASKPMHGNPVAVFFGADRLPDDTLQRIAREMNLSESTFVLPATSGGDARVRIFTPVNELPFAGHPLLGTAVALARRKRGRLRLETGMGTIAIDAELDASELGFATMRQPVPTWSPYEHSEILLRALGLQRAELPVEMYVNGPRHVLVACPDVATLSTLQPNLSLLGTLPNMAAICFARSEDGWRSRMFSPAYGVTEDAATGSSAGPIAIHLARYGYAPYGSEVNILQGVEMGRPSLMRAVARGSGEHVESVEVSGHAVIVGDGELRV